jgi:hypothetical protein
MPSATALLREPPSFSSPPPPPPSPATTWFRPNIFPRGIARSLRSPFPPHPPAPGVFTQSRRLTQRRPILHPKYLVPRPPIDPSHAHPEHAIIALIERPRKRVRRAASELQSPLPCYALCRRFGLVCSTIYIHVIFVIPP